MWADLQVEPEPQLAHAAVHLATLDPALEAPDPGLCNAAQADEPSSVRVVEMDRRSPIAPRRPEMDGPRIRPPERLCYDDRIPKLEYKVKN